ncbi:MAG: helix-turn-helix domain-containing protein [Opitutales bacterium]|nr:helix-turn-helix domain-containing protein [Opitutales bacterium]
MKPFIFLQSFAPLPNSPAIMEAFCRKWQSLSPIPIRMRPSLIREWVTSPDCRGVVVPLGHQDAMAELAGITCPIVNYSAHLPPPASCLNLRYDSGEIGEIAADHLCEQGYPHFGYLRLRGCAFSDDRMEAFRQALQKRGHTLEAVFDFVAPADSPLTYNELFERAVAEWLAPLPRSLGILSANDTLARDYYWALNALDPDLLQLQALIGVDDDYPHWVKFSMGPKAPPLTSIRLNYKGLGEACAQSLREAVVNGDYAPGRVRYVNGAELIRRESSGGFSCGDPLVAQLARWAANSVEKGEAPGMLALQERFAMPRRLLAERFRQYTGKSLREFILQMRVQRAARLLRKTELSVAEIAQQCGFNKHADLTERFGKYMGCSPSEYRTRCLGD